MKHTRIIRLYQVLLWSVTLAACQKDGVKGPTSIDTVDTLWVKTSFPTGVWNVSLDVAFNAIYAGTEDTGLSRNYYTLRTVDRGNSWQLVGNGLLGEIRAVSNGSGGNTFAVTNANPGLFRSVDSGNTWLSCGIGNVGFWSVRANSLGYVFATTKQSGVFRSTDNGLSWTQLLTGLDRNSAYVTIAFSNTGTIFMGGDGLYRSTNNGDTWATVDTTVFRLFIWQLAVGSSGALFAATSNGIFVSTDNGAVWIRKYDIESTCLAINLRGDIFVAGYHHPGIAFSVDNGNRWNLFGSSRQEVAVLAVDSDGFLYASRVNDAALYRTRNSTLP